MAELCRNQQISKANRVELLVTVAPVKSSQARHHQSLYGLYPNSVWSCGVPNSPCLQLSGSLHAIEGGRVGLHTLLMRKDLSPVTSLPRTFATPRARIFASSLLSPSITNSSSAKTGRVDCADAEIKRRVRPPPGMKGTSASLFLDGGCIPSKD